MSNNNNNRGNMTRKRTALKSLKRKDTVGIILLGDVEVGKSALIRRWMNDEFPAEYNATVEDFFMKTVVSLNQRVNVTIVDIAGGRQFPSMDDLYMKKSEVVMLVYETGNEKSIKSLKRYYNCACETMKERKVNYVVVATKHDLHESDTSLMKPIDEINDLFEGLLDPPAQFQTSAKTGDNVSELFEHAIKEVVKRNSVHDRRSKFEKQITIEQMEDEKETNDRKCGCTLL